MYLLGSAVGSFGQGSLTTISAERDSLRDQLGLAQSDLTRVTTIREQMKTSLTGAQPVVNTLISCYQDEQNLTSALVDFVNGTITVAQLNQAIDIHNIGHQSGACSNAISPAHAWLNGLNAFGISS